MPIPSTRPSASTSAVAVLEPSGGLTTRTGVRGLRPTPRRRGMRRRLRGPPRRRPGARSASAPPAEVGGAGRDEVGGLTEDEALGPGGRPAGRPPVHTEERERAVDVERAAGDSHQRVALSRICEPRGPRRRRCRPGGRPGSGPRGSVPSPMGPTYPDRPRSAHLGDPWRFPLGREAAWPVTVWCGDVRRLAAARRAGCGRRALLGLMGLVHALGRIAVVQFLAFRRTEQFSARIWRAVGHGRRSRTAPAPRPSTSSAPERGSSCWWSPCSARDAQRP